MFNTIEEAVEEIRKGRMVIVVDDEGRENEGDLVMAAEKVTPEAVNFMARYGRGLICMPVTGETARRLELNPMVENNTDRRKTAFTVSVDHKETSTGISAFDRALTVRKVLAGDSLPGDFDRPGHIFPLVAAGNGVLERAGHTEAAVELARLAGLKPAGVIVEVMKEDGSMARQPELARFAEEHGLAFITIRSLIEYLGRLDPVEEDAEAALPTRYGEFRMHGFTDRRTGKQHIALVKGNVSGKENVLTRIHSECLTGDAFGSSRCDCGEQLDAAMKRISDKGEGVLVYMRQEGRGIGLINKVKAYALQDQGYDTVEANELLGFAPDQRSYEAASAILRHLGVLGVDLMTNNPAKIDGIGSCGIAVNERIGIQMPLNECNAAYLRTKQTKLNHLLEY